MKKYCALFLFFFLIPSFAYASWWNPFSWFSKKQVPITLTATTSVSVATSTTIEKKVILPEKKTAVQKPTIKNKVVPATSSVIQSPPQVTLPLVNPNPIQVTYTPPTNTPASPTQTNIVVEQKPEVSEPVVIPVDKPKQLSIRRGTPCQMEVKTEYNLEDLLQNGNIDGRIFMNAYLLDSEGRNFYNTNPAPVMTITTSDNSNNKTLNGSGNTGPCGYYYPFEFYAVVPGNYSITYSVSVFNLSKTLNIVVK